jgi:tetratricopeptide (TPR) repeat protein
MDIITRRATQEYHLCEYPEARKDIETAEMFARKERDAGALAAAEIIDGQLAAEVGDYAYAKARFKEAILLRRALRSFPSIPPLNDSLGLAEAKCGEAKSAEKHLMESLGGYQEYHDGVGIAIASRDLGSLALERGDLVAAESWLSKARVEARNEGKEDIVTDVDAQRALVLRDKHRFDQARGLLEKALAYWQHRHHARWIAETLFQKGTVEAVAGRSEEASPLLLKSEALFQSVGDKPGADQCRRWRVSGPPQATASGAAKQDPTS